MAAIYQNIEIARGSRFPARPLFWSTAALKALVLALCVLVLLRPDLPQLQGKAMTARALLSPFGIFVLAVGWRLVTRRRAAPPPFPFLADILLTLPFAVDLLGNALDLYDPVPWFDDVTHLVGGTCITGGIGLLLRPVKLSPAVAAGLMVGLAAVVIILWEEMEYVAFIRHSPELATAYEDTLGDQALGLLGAAVATLAVLLPTRRPRRRTASSWRLPALQIAGATSPLEDAIPVVGRHRSGRRDHRPGFAAGRLGDEESPCPIQAGGAGNRPGAARRLG